MSSAAVSAGGPEGGTVPGPEFARSLTDWYRACARDLPWRRTKDAYRIWVSEIMLQQTRVETVIPYYLRFIRELPGLKELAACPEDALLKLWEGLGYYSRVRNMQKAAAQLAARGEGSLPSSFEELLKLPGIGPYTAGAVASIAFGEAVPAVDGNVMRVCARVLADRENILDAGMQRRVREMLTRVIPAEEPGLFNQAMMELGAMICRSGPAPSCGECPVRFCCRAAAEGLTAQIPVRIKKTDRRMQERTILAVTDRQFCLLRKRPGRGLLAGLYELPGLEGHVSPGEALSYLGELGLTPLRIQPLPPAKHVFSHIEWQMTGYLVHVEDLCSPGLREPFLAADPAQAEKAAIPSAFGAYIPYLKITADRPEAGKMENGNENTDSGNTLL